MRQDNIFKVGDVVDGESLIGYNEVYRKLQRNILYNKGNLALVGLHRMGKTSLIKKLHKEAKNTDAAIIPVFVNLQELVACDNQNFFDSLLIYVAEKVKGGLARRRRLDQCENFCCEFDEFAAARPGGTAFRDSFKRLFEEIKDLNMHVLLSMDEFDSAERIFKTTADYELFRSLAAPDYAVSLVFISRRRLYMIEKKNENNSTFHSAFRENPLVGFSDEDVQLLFETLKINYDICLAPDQMERIKYYAGRSPYIYSAFCHELVEEKICGQNSFDPDEIYKKNITSIVTDYAEVLYQRLQTDGHLAKLLGILFGPSFNVTQSDRDLLGFMGYLSDLNDGDYYQALSGYFTDFLRNKYFVDDSWKNIIDVEKLMKSLILEAFPNLDDEKWHALMDDAYIQFFGNEKKFNYSLYKGYISNNLKIFNKHSILPEVLSLSDVFVIIRFRWEEIFKKYFAQKAFEELKEKFELCASARNPLAHGHEEYLTKLQQERVNIYCREILELVKKSRRSSDSSATSASLTEEKKSPPYPPISDDKAQISRSNIGKIGMLTNIIVNKSGGIKGRIFGAPGTVAKAALSGHSADYQGRNLRVKVIDINPQGNGYLLKPVDS